MPVTDCGSAGDPAANTILGASTCAPKPAWITAKWCEQGCTSTSTEGETNWCQQPVLGSLSGFFLCFCLESIPKEREGGSCQGGLLCQHLNRISSGCSHLIPAVPHFWSLFQSFYLSLKAFNCFLSVPGLDSAQVPGWRYPLGHGIVARAAVAGTPSRAAQSCASAAVRGLCVGKSRLRGSGKGRKTQVMGGFVALLDVFSPGKIISPFVSLGEAGRGVGRASWSMDICYSSCYRVSGPHVYLFSLQDKPETWRKPHRKPALSGFPPTNGVAQNCSGKREGFSSRNFGRRHFE